MNEMKSCATCIYSVRASSQCAKLQINVDLQRDTCPFYSNVPKICSICHRTFADLFIDSKDNAYLCAECLKMISSCELCINGGTCSFESDPSPLLKVVMRNVRQGNMTIQTQVRNPERVKITCANGCPCYQNSECMRQYGQCGKQKYIGDEK